MSLIKRFTPSPAMVIGCLALLLTLGGHRLCGQQGAAAEQRDEHPGQGPFVCWHVTSRRGNSRAAQPVLQVLPGPPVRRARPVPPARVDRRP